MLLTTTLQMHPEVSLPSTGSNRCILAVDGEEERRPKERYDLLVLLLRLWGLLL